MFSLLKTLYINFNLIHLNEFELIYWHIINMQMLEEGLWSRFKFKTALKSKLGKNTSDSKEKAGFRSLDHSNFADILLMTALIAKKLCNDEDEYEVYQEFIFHNLDEANE